MHFEDDRVQAFSTGSQDMRRLFGDRNAEHRFQEFRTFLHINNVTESSEVKKLAQHPLGK